jgi:predicted DNA-binding protein
MAACSLGGIAAADCKPCTHDAITNAPLNPRYIEFITPDGKTRLCYNASTLGRIRRNGHLAQPPHFRFRMCAADEKKVIDAFPLLRRQTSAAARGISARQMNRYLMRVESAYEQMTTKALYACPVAWTQLTCGNKQSYADDDIWARRTAQDPMLVCHNYIIQREAQGHDGFTELAAVFHTGKRNASTHLERGYHLETSEKFSQLIERYSMRGADGIVQNYLTSRGRKKGYGDLFAYWDQDYHYHKSLYMSLWLYNKTVDAQTGTLLPGYNPAAAGEIMDRLESIVAPTSDSDSSFIAASSEEEEHNSSELDERASAAALDRRREQTQNELFAKAAKLPSETKRRKRIQQKRRRQAAARAWAEEMLNEDEDFYNSPEVLESVEEAEREKAKKKSRRKRRKPSGAAAVMFDSDEEDFTSSFNFALRF